ncbi:Ankyrin repeat protein [Podosphaera aphanis]|nr:Ankyrin repeat protein [Podosphaera aphanis]
MSSNDVRGECPLCHVETSLHVPHQAISSRNCVDLKLGVMKFGKWIQKRQVEVPEYAANFVNYKALKKLIRKLSATPILTAQNENLNHSKFGESQTTQQTNKSVFFSRLEEELVKVNAMYLQKEPELKIRLTTLLEKKKVLQSRNQITLRRSAKFTALEEGFKQFVNELNKLQQFVEINGLAFSKILKKWDKTSKSKTKELYLSRAVEVQPFFNAIVISELSDQATTSLQELGAWSEGDYFSLDRSFVHTVNSQQLPETDDGDDIILLKAVSSGNYESLKCLLSKFKNTPNLDDEGDIVLKERITRTFFSAINGGSQQSLQLLLDTRLVDLESEDDINGRNCLHLATIYDNIFVLEVGLRRKVPANRMDVYGRTPLHYACMHGRLDMTKALINADRSIIDLIDHDNFTPLIHAIKHNHQDCVEHLLGETVRINPMSDADHVPLNLACEFGSATTVELLLKHNAKILPDAEGLYPQHLVARSGKNPHLLLLLKEYGADLDQIDKFSSWTPLFHAANEGNVECIQVLLDVNIQVNTLDEKGLSALYYAAWEGNLGCVQLLFSVTRKHQDTKKSSQSGPVPGRRHSKKITMDVDSIPELELPPPIIPLRRCGHNFLDTKTLVQIFFEEDSDQLITFFHDGKYPAARLTISSKLSDMIPKNITLPFQDETRLVSFQIDNLDSFTIDFEVFPTYGAKVIAKTVALPDTFRSLTGSSGRCCLPLFDPRLRAIGQIAFRFQVIQPFQGKNLELADFESYWKATSQSDHRPTLFITGSSLSDDYVQVIVQNTSDGVPVLWSKWTINYLEIEFTVNCLTYQQFKIAGSKYAEKHKDLFLTQGKPLEANTNINYILSNLAISLKDALELLPRGVHANLQILYPSLPKERTSNMYPTMSLNLFSDAILSVIFDHVRALRERCPDAMRSIVFSSFNPTICTALNWKQPNFPVFLCNDFGRDNNPVIGDSSHRKVTSIKEVVRIAKENNLMGLFCSSRLLEIVPELIDSVKAHGLVVLTEKSPQSGAATEKEPGLFTSPSE